MELLSPSAQHTHLFTWISQNGHEEDVDGLMIVALILSSIRPNFKVDMYSEITKVKQLTIAQYDNDVQLFLMFNCSSTQLSFSSFISIKRILLHTLRKHSSEVGMVVGDDVAIDAHK